MSKELTRRQFLTAATALAVTGTQPIRVLGASTQENLSARLPETIRVGIIGFDGHYSEITNAAKLVPNIRITAVADPNPAALQGAAANPMLAKATAWADYHEMLGAEKLDIVAVCGQNGTRATTVRACAEHGLPIVTEKPLALSLSELETVKRAIGRNGVPLTMLLTMRCAPQYQAMRSMIQSGRIGEVVSLDAQKSYKLGTRPGWMKVRKSYGGIIPYIGIHLVDLMRWISGRELVEAAAFQSKVGFPEIGEMENNTAVIFKLDNRGTASLHLDYLRPATAPTHGVNEGCFVFLE
jgi:predicted dehydrogenase